MTRLMKLLFAGALMMLPLPVSGGEDKPADADAESATHNELEPLAVKFEKLSSLRLTPDGMLLAGDEKAKQIKVIDPSGKVTATIELPFNPESIDTAEDGVIYCGGQGEIAMLDKTGKLIKTVAMPKEKGTPKPAGAPPKRSRPQRVSGIAVTGKDVFVAFGSSWSLRSTSNLYRFDRQLQNPKRIAEGLRGCCQRCDITARDGVVYVAENTRHRIVAFDRDGKELGKWGQRGRAGLDGFGACCNPMNLCFDGAGSLYTSESGLGRVKRYSTDGKLLSLVGYTGVERFTRAGHLAASCSNIAIAVTPDGARVYVMDYTKNLIRVLQKKDE